MYCGRASFVKYLLLFFYPPLLPSGTRTFAHGTERERERERKGSIAPSKFPRIVRLTIPLLLLDIALRHVDTDRRHVRSMDVSISRFTQRLRIRFISIRCSILSPIWNYFILSRCANKLKMVFQLLGKIRSLFIFPWNQCNDYLKLHLKYIYIF